MRICPTDVVRRAIGLLGVAAAAAMVLIVSDVAYTVARTVCTSLAAANTDYGYVADLVRHRRSWNFRRGLGVAGRPALAA